MPNCPICENLLTSASGDSATCPRCGTFEINAEARSFLQQSPLVGRQFANASGWIRENQGIKIDLSLIKYLSEIETPSVARRAEKLLLKINNKNTSISDSLTITRSSQEWLGISYSLDQNEVRYLIQSYLKDHKGYVDHYSTMGPETQGIVITPSGHEYIESINTAQLNSKIGFCAMWFSTDVLPIWTNAISPAIQDSGYDPIRIDTHNHNNRIDDEIIAMLRRSKFVVADFTGQRGGVYFEAGFALGLGLQVIWTCEESELSNLHFDTRQYNFLTWKIDKLADFKNALQNRIEATLGVSTT